MECGVPPPLERPACSTDPVRFLYSTGFDCNHAERWFSSKIHAWAVRHLSCPSIHGSDLMKEKELLIENKLGLHARAAAQIVKTASAYSSKITLVKDGMEVDGKSIMGIMMLAAAKGSSVMLQVNGEDEGAALSCLEQLFKDKFGEKE